MIAEKGLHDRCPVRVGSRGDDLNRCFRLHVGFRKIFRIVDQSLLADKEPVGHEDDLQHADRFALEFEVSVPPRPQSVAREVPLCDIDAAREADPSVYDQNFSVIAVVDVAGEPWKDYRHEAFDVDSCTTQFFDESMT